jgi:hypothetical protein
VKLCPFRVACVLSALPSCRSAFRLPQVSGPSNGIPQASPTVKGAVRSPLGSALGFSQPLSGFLAGLSFAALFHAATVTGTLPLELSPHKDRLPLSRLHAPLQLFTGVLKRTARLPYRHRFHRLPRFHAVAWIPPETMDALFTNRSSLPSCPGLRAAESSRSASFTCFEALLPLRIRSQPVRVAPC